MKIWSDTVQDTEWLGEMFAQTLTSGDAVWLLGDLGAGKTAFVRGLARGLGCAEPVTSPTYTIAHEYTGNPALFHFDAYRLDGWEDLLDIGWEDYLVRGVCAVEWAQRLRPLPDYGVRVTLSAGENGRWIEIEP